MPPLRDGRPLPGLCGTEIMSAALVDPGTGYCWSCRSTTILTPRAGDTSADVVRLQIPRRNPYRPLWLRKFKREYISVSRPGVELTSLEARAAARTGDRRLALDALGRAARAREAPLQGDELENFGGLLRFPVSTQHYYAASAYALLGNAGQAQDNSLLAIRMYESGPVEQRSYGNEALARVDVTTARLALGDLDGAREALRPVLELPPQRRIEQLTVGLSTMRAALIVPRYARAHLAREITQELDHYHTESLTHSLLLAR